MGGPPRLFLPVGSCYPRMCFGRRSPTHRRPLWAPLTSIGERRDSQPQGRDSGARQAPKRLTPLVARPAVCPAGPAANGCDAGDDMNLRTLRLHAPRGPESGWGARVASQQLRESALRFPTRTLAPLPPRRREDALCLSDSQNGVRRHGRPGSPEGLSPELPLRRCPTWFGQASVGRPDSVRSQHQGEPP